MEYQHQHYLVNNNEHVSSASPDYQEKLATAYQIKKPLNCLCKTDEDGVGPLCYIAKIKTQKEGVKYIIKRLPETGEQHAPTCEHYGLPETLSGKALLSKDAIVEDPNTGLTNIKISVPFSKKLGNAMSMGSGATSLNVGDKGDTTTKIQAAQLNLIGLLHYILDATQLNRWSPNMMGENDKVKRYYGLLYFLVMRTVAKTIAKKQSLADKFFMPQYYHPNKAEACNKAFFDFKQSLRPTKTQAPMGIFFGQYKRFEEGYNCGKLVPGHVQHKNALRLSSMDVVAKLMTKHDEKFGLAQVYSDDLTLFFIATVYYQHGELWVDSIDFQLFTKEWMPIADDVDAWRLNQQLIRDKRYFQVPMRFALGKDKALAQAVLTDTGKDSVPLFFEHDVIKPKEDEDVPMTDEPEETTMSEEVADAPAHELDTGEEAVTQAEEKESLTETSYDSVEIGQQDFELNPEFTPHSDQSDQSILEPGELDIPPTDFDNHDGEQGDENKSEESSPQEEYIELPLNAVVINAYQEKWVLPRKGGC